MNTAITAETEAAAAIEQTPFITTPAITMPGGQVVAPFQVAQYLSSEDSDGKVIVSEQAMPWVEINFHQAKTAAAAAGLKLITETQWLAIAHDIANQDINWTGGKVGEGSLFMGLHKWTVEEAQAGNYVSPDPDERRWFELSNGARIYDFSGNAFSWVFDDVQGDDQGLIAKPFASDSPSLTTAPFPSMEKGTGWRPSAGSDLSGDALIRGSCWGSDDRAGAFNLNFDWPDLDDDFVGFRCTK
jgi:formylglycine-generating enzyme required for sulfatase activity